MELNYCKKENIVIIYLQGHIDIYVASAIEKKINKLIASESASDLILNLNDVDYVSSAGLGIFISIMGILKKKQRKLVFCNMNDVVIKILGILNLTDMFHIFRTENEAVEFLKEGTESC